MKATRELWGKTEGIQAHHIIQSFKPGEVTPEMANEIGRDLAKEVAKGHEAVVYTHTDKDHIHNHIVINSVNYENGSKYHASKESLYQIREANDRLCKERGLSVVQEKDSPIRYTLAEKGLLDKGEISWKEEIRKVIDHEKTQAKTYDEFKQNLQENYGIEVKERGKNITFTHPENGRKVRGSKLGNDYEKETIQNGFERQIERKTEPSQKRGNTGLSSEQSRGSERAERVAEANERFERPHEGLHQNEHGQVNSREADLRHRDNQHQDHQQTSHDRNAFDIDEARKALERKRSDVAKGFDRFTQRDETEQQSNPSKDGADRGQSQQGNDRNQEPHADRNQQHEQELTKQDERVRSQQQEIDFER
jgi:hypothetical protein